MAWWYRWQTLLQVSTPTSSRVMEVDEAWRTWLWLTTRNASSSIEGETSIKSGVWSLILEWDSLCEVDSGTYSTHNAYSGSERGLVTLFFRRAGRCVICNLGIALVAKADDTGSRDADFNVRMHFFVVLFCRFHWEDALPKRGWL